MAQTAQGDAADVAMPGALVGPAVLAMPIEVPADAPVPLTARAPWPAALSASAYSLAYRMSYGGKAYRFASGRAAAARSAMAHGWRKGRSHATGATLATVGRGRYRQDLLFK